MTTMTETIACESVVALQTFDDLAGFVHHQLCKTDQLDVEQTPLRQTMMNRGGIPCGIIFHAVGPRLLRTSAVWAADEARIIFYDSKGQRHSEVRLSESPDIHAENPQSRKPR